MPVLVQFWFHQFFNFFFYLICSQPEIDQTRLLEWWTGHGLLSSELSGFGGGGGGGGKGIQSCRCSRHSGGGGGGCNCRSTYSDCCWCRPPARGGGGVDVGVSTASPEGVKLTGLAGVSVSPAEPQVPPDNQPGRARAAPATPGPRVALSQVERRHPPSTNQSVL